MQIYHFKIRKLIIRTLNATSYIAPLYILLSDVADTRSLKIDNNRKSFCPASGSTNKLTWMPSTNSNFIKKVLYHLFEIQNSFVSSISRGAGRRWRSSEVKERSFAQ